MAGLAKRSTLRDLLTFRKPKTPGFGISRDYYLSVLSPTAVLPSIEQVLQPDGRDGALRGFGAPLDSSKNRSDLSRPLERGSYVCASLDRKTIIKLMVIPREEAGFDPAAILRSPLAQLLESDARARIAATWTLIQLSFEAHDPMVYPSADFMLDLAHRLATLVGGVVADPLSQAYKVPESVRCHPPLPGPIDARNFVAVVMRDSKNGPHSYTLGLVKFGMPEFEIYGVSQADEAVSRFLLGLSQTVLVHGPVTAGALVGAAAAPLEVCAGGLDRATWEGIACFELTPSRGRTADECVRAYCDESGA